MENGLISVIMPVYNGEKYIYESIQSVISQDYQNWELLIVNDGSTDNTEYIVKSILNSKIRYFKQENKGVSNARNLALKQMNGEYFCFLDADDLFTKTSLSSRIEIFNENKYIDFVDGIIEKKTSDLEQLLEVYKPQFKGNPFYELLSLSGKCFFGITWMIKRNYNQSYQFNEGMSHAEDLLFFISISKIGEYSYTEKVTTICRSNPTSAMKNIRGLEEGYYNLIKSLKNVTPTPHFSLKFKISRIMFKTHFKNGNIIGALRIIKKYLFI